MVWSLWLVRKHKNAQVKWDFNERKRQSSEDDVRNAMQHGRKNCNETKVNEIVKIWEWSKDAENVWQTSAFVSEFFFFLGQPGPTCVNYPKCKHLRLPCIFYMLAIFSFRTCTCRRLRRRHCRCCCHLRALKLWESTCNTRKDVKLKSQDWKLKLNDTYL